MLSECLYQYGMLKILSLLSLVYLNTISDEPSLMLRQFRWELGYLHPWIHSLKRQRNDQPTHIPLYCRLFY